MSNLTPSVQLPHAARNNPAVVETVVDVLRAGGYRRTAAKMARVSPSTLDRWITRGEELVVLYEDTGEEPTEEERWYMELALQVNGIEGDVEMRAAAQVRQAGNNGDWRASSWFLQHRFKDKWSPKSELEQHTSGMDGEVDEDVESALELLANRLNAIEAEVKPRAVEVIDAEVVDPDGE